MKKVQEKAPQIKKQVSASAKQQQGLTRGQLIMCEDREAKHRRPTRDIEGRNEFYVCRFRLGEENWRRLMRPGKRREHVPERRMAGGQISLQSRNQNKKGWEDERGVLFRR